MCGRSRFIARKEVATRKNQKLMEQGCVAIAKGREMEPVGANVKMKARGNLSIFILGFLIDIY